jgi:hypothetical protein
VDAARQFDVGQAAVALQLVENAQIDRVQLHEMLPSGKNAEFYAAEQPGKTWNQHPISSRPA